jgi:hypothetical protein
MMNRCLASEFARLVRLHDLTFAFSDDHRVWLSGQDSLTKIMVMRGKLDEGVANAIWNAEVDRKLASDEVRERFYWGS